MSRSAVWSWFLPLVAVAVVVTTISYVVFARDKLPQGPSEVVWDRSACAACQMHVGEPAFAAQAQLRDGRTLMFDDHGCLLLMLPEIEADVHALWFRHLREDRWLRGDAVAFITASPSPMGFDIGAVDKGTPDSATLAATRVRILAKEEGR